MSFTQGKEFQRQLDFQKDRIIDVLKQKPYFFEHRNLAGELDNPVELPDGCCYDDTEVESIECVTPDGKFETYYQGNPVRTLTLEDLKKNYNNEFLVKLLVEIESTQNKIFQEELDY